LQAGFRYARTLTWDHERARDLLQEACAAVIQAKGPWQKTYLFQAIRSRHLDQVRKARLAVVEPYDDEAAASGGEYPFHGDVEKLIATRDQLERAMADLRPEEREAIYLAGVEDLPTSQVATLMGRPRNSVLSLIHRGRQKLRRRIAESEGTEVAS
jgi:RNA polymerase sigma-70 factor (ECF subfamily)